MQSATPARVPFAWQPGFLADLAAGGNVARACRAAGVTKHAVYRRAHRSPAFAAAMLKARAAFFSSIVPPEGAARD